MDTKKTLKFILSALVTAAFLFLLFYYEQDKRKNGYTLSILERSAIYAVVAVSMNLLTGCSHWGRQGSWRLALTPWVS